MKKKGSGGGIKLASPNPSPADIVTVLSNAPSKLCIGSKRTCSSMSWE